MTSIIVLDSSDEETEPAKKMSRPPLQQRLPGAPLSLQKTPPPQKILLQQKTPPPQKIPLQQKTPPPQKIPLQQKTSSQQKPLLHTKPQIIELPRKSPISIVRLDKSQQQQRAAKCMSPNSSALATISKKGGGVDTVTITTVPACLRQTSVTTAFPPATISPSVFRPETTTSSGIFRKEKPETSSGIFRIERPETCSGVYRKEKPEPSPGIYRLDKHDLISRVIQLEKPESSSRILQPEKHEISPAAVFRLDKPETSTAPATTIPRNCVTPEKPEASSSMSSSRSSTPHTVISKRKISESSENGSEKSMKRIKPTQISDKVDKSWVASQSPVIAIDDDGERPPENDKTSDSIQNGGGPPSVGSSKDETAQEEEDSAPIHPTYAALLEACRAADSSPDMEKLIKTKLLRYYHSVHPDFVVSKGFCKTVKAVTKEIQDSPGLVYYKLKNVVEELKIRRKSKETVISNEEVTSTGDERTDMQVRRLSKALYIITKKIAALEEADVDLDDDNSSYLQVERYKKRACEIYNMICDLTGESKHAHRSVKKPITFRGTSFPEFNRTLQSFVNRTKTFPDFYDVYRCLEHCNAQYCLGLKNDQIKSVAQDAFVQIGKLLQNRRKSDLYETVAHFTGCSADPAESDPALNAKLHENQKYHTKITSIIEKFAKEQEVVATENVKNKLVLKDGENKTPPEPTPGSSTEEHIEKDNEEEIVEIPSSCETVPSSSADLSKSGGWADCTTKIAEKPPADTQPTKKAVDLPVVEEIIISDEES